MVAITERKSAYEKALLIASGPAMLERMVRPLKEAGLAVNACENFEDAAKFYDGQALIVLPIKEDAQTEAKAFVDRLRSRAVASPYILGVGRCEEAQRKSLVAKMGLNDLITYPFDEAEVQQRLESFRNWCQMPTPNAMEAPDETDVVSPTVADTIPSEMLQTTRVSLFSDTPSGEEAEAPESIYCRESPVGIAMFDRKLTYLLANPRWIQQFRLKDKEVIGRSQFDVFPKLHPNWHKIYKRCLKGETRRGRETIQSVDGPLDMRWEVRPWRYRSGQVGGVTIAFEEAWKPADELPAKASEEKLPAAPSLSNQLQSPALVLDLNGTVIESNDSAKALKLDQPGEAFVEALKDDPNQLPLTELVELQGGAEHLAWSTSILRDTDGEPERVLRVGVRLPCSLLPTVEVEKVVEVSAAEEAQIVVSETEPIAPSLTLFEDDALDEVPQLVWKANPRGEITYFNRAWLKFRDRPLSRELNGGWLDGLHASDACSTKGVVAEAIRNQKTLEHTFRLKSAGGNYVSKDMWVKPFHAESGELLGFYGICQDHQEGAKPAAIGFASALYGAPQRSKEEDQILNTVRQDAADALAKLAEAEHEVLDLKDSLAKLSTASSATGSGPGLLPESPFIMWQCDTAGDLTAVNPTWNEAFQLDGKAAPQSNWTEAILDEKERRATEAQLRAAAVKGASLTCTFHWKPSSASATRMELQAVPLLDENGNSLGLSGILQDVSAEQAAISAVQALIEPQAETIDPAPVSDLFAKLTERLPQWQERQAQYNKNLAAFEEIFDHVAVGVVLLGSNGKVIIANKRLNDLLGFSIGEGESIEGWLGRAGGDPDHTTSVLKIWQEDIWQRQLTKVLALKASNGSLREIRFEPQLFLDDNRLLLTLHDITESKRSEEAMRDSEIRFRALFRESSMGIALLDGEEKIYDVNPGMESILGVARRQILCRHFDECLHPDDLARKQQLVQQLLASPKRNTEMELRLARRREEGGITEDIWVRLHIALVRDVDQRVLFTAYFVQDITEQKRLQAALHISKEQNRALLEIIPDLILLVDRRAEIVDIMPGDSMPDDFVDQESMGRRVETILPSFGNHAEELIQRAYVADDVVVHQFATPSGNAYQARVVACKPDNAVITVQSAPDKETPVTPLKPEIPESLERMSLTFANAPNAVIIMNYSGGIQHWNPAASELFGYTEQEAEDQPLPALFGLDSVDALTRHLEQDSHDRWVGRLPFQRKDRSEDLAEVIFAPLKAESGSLQGQVAFLRQVEDPEPKPIAPAAAGPAVDRQALIEEIREESLSTLVPQMHQRLRNNLQIIATLLNLQYKCQADPNTRDSLRKSRSRAQALLLLHERIQKKEDEEQVDFQHLAKSLCDFLLESYEAVGRVHVTLEIDGPLDLQAASPLSLILNELVSNAIEHGFPDGEQGTIAVTLKLAQGTGELTVRDDGFGLGSGSQGSGMGLQIVKTLATQVGGSLEKLDTTETEFRVCFITSLRK